MRRLKAFLALYPPVVSRSVRVGVVVSACMSIVDFASLLLLLPVFSQLAGGGQGSIRLIPWSIEPRSLALAAMTLMILRSMSMFVFRWWWSRQASRAELALSSRLLGAYAHAPYSFHLRSNSSELLTRTVSHVGMATNTGLNAVVLASADLTMTAGLAAGLFVANPWAALAVVCYLSLVAALFIFWSRRVTVRAASEYSGNVSHVYRLGSNLLRGIRELTVSDGRDEALGSVGRARGQMVAAQKRMILIGEVPKLTLEVALYGAILIALMVMLSSSNASDTLALVALYVVAGMRLLPALTRVLTYVNQFRTGTRLGEEIANELESVATARLSEPAGSAGAMPARARLEVEGIHFAYDPDRPEVLAGISLDIPFGSHVGFVGSSGGGKSTLLNIILGLLKPTAGTVTYGGVSVGLANPEWFGKIGYVPQDVFLLDDTVGRNVALGDLTPDAERVWAALRDASMEGVVRSLDRGLDSTIGEAGSRLSVGQRQRLGIARALYRQPEVLILDEPTAALDAKTELEIVDTINGLRQNMTIISVAHRVGTLVDCDVVYELHGGRALQRDSA